MTSEVIEVAQLDLAKGIRPLRTVPGAAALRLLVRIGRRMLGEVVLRPDGNGVVAADAIAAAVATRLAQELMHAGISGWLADAGRSSPAAGWDAPAQAVRAGLDRLVSDPDVAEEPLPSITVAVCTRDRPEDLARCLDAIDKLDYPDYEVVVVDNAPATDATRRIVAERFPHMRYVLEQRPGLDWARNRAIAEARGEVIAYTDDDTEVDTGWLLAIGRLFAASPGLAAVTGSVVPLELETPAQRLFEAYGGFLRGWRREWYRATQLQSSDTAWHHGAGRFGTGANMAFRRSVLTELGGFDPALDVGTASDGGGDLEMYFRVLQEGYTLAYSPDALVRHRHRREMRELERQLKQWGTGFAAYVKRSLAAYPGERRAFRAMMRWWWRTYFARRVARALTGRSGVPLRFTLGEAAGLRGGAAAYDKAVKQADRIAADHPPAPLPDAPPIECDPPGDRQASSVSVCTLDIRSELVPLTNLNRVAAVEAVVMNGTVPIAKCRLTPEGGTVGVPQMLERVSEGLAAALSHGDRESVLAEMREWVGRRLPASGALPSVTIMLSTADRPDDLRRALRSITAQRYAGAMEVVVVDNRPDSGLTSGVVAEFPQVRLVSERRSGASYGRNAGIAASTGEIIVMTDDDVVAPDEWVARLVESFSRPDVAAVSGNVLPLELDTEAQRLFELYGGLGKGFVRLEYEAAHYRRRFKPVPAWYMGATANCAIRASVLADPTVGLFDESLGAGTPAGGSEDAYMYYRILNAGFTVVYDPRAWLWHSHRKTMPELERQVRAYSTGHVAYHLRILFAHRDFRALRRLLADLPLHDARSLWRVFRGRSAFPFSFVMAECLGHLTGPWALWKSTRRVRRLGRSSPIVRQEVTDTGADASRLEPPGAEVEFGPEVPVGADEAENMQNEASV